MKYWPTLVLLLILAALGGYLYWVELPSQRQEEQQETASRTLLPFPETAITGLSLSTPQGIVEMVLRDGGRWAITAPLQAEADSREVQSLIRALVTGKVTRTVDDIGSALAPFGLDQPVTTVTVKAGAQQETISIGDSGPLSNTLYVLRGSDHKGVAHRPRSEELRKQDPLDVPAQGAAAVHTERRGAGALELPDDGDRAVQHGEGQAEAFVEDPLPD
jgi:hypothetical protein